MSVKKGIEDFIKLLEKEEILLEENDSFKNDKNSIYNEFSLQHELGIFLRKNNNGYKIEFERNISYFLWKESEKIKEFKNVKKEIDISIYNNLWNPKYAIELKFPKNWQYPDQMYSFCKDIAFLEKLIFEANFDKGYFIAIVGKDNHLFYEKWNETNWIYEYFRKWDKNKEIERKILKPTWKWKNIDYIKIVWKYKIKWKDLKWTNFKYIFLEI